MIKMANIPNTVVTFDGVTYLECSGFNYSRSYVSVSLFGQFVEASGYLTTAERCGYRETWKNNHFLQELKIANVREIPVTELSYLDAARFCQFVALQLPTDLQHMAACTVSINTKHISDLRLQNTPRVSIEYICESFIRTSGHLGRVRRGPSNFLDNWQREAICTEVDLDEVFSAPMLRVVKE